MKVGDKIGKILLLEKIGRGYHKDAMWKCQCDCGNIFYRYTSSVKKGKSCGCDKYKDLTGKKFGRLTVIKKVGIYKKNNSKWLCKCDCGNEIIVCRNNLSINKNRTVSCGCWRKEYIAKHNKCKTKIYNAYLSMKQRYCNPNNPAYSYYGGRGIKICNEWLDKENGFINFYNWSMQNGYREDLTIDRIDVNSNYEPSNCRWITMKQQANNKRNNRYVTYKGKTHTIAEWAKLINMPYTTVYNNLVNKNNYKILDSKEE